MTQQYAEIKENTVTGKKVIEVNGGTDSLIVTVAKSQEEFTQYEFIDSYGFLHWPYYSMESSIYPSGAASQVEVMPITNDNIIGCQAETEYPNASPSSRAYWTEEDRQDNYFGSAFQNWYIRFATDLVAEHLYVTLQRHVKWYSSIRDTNNPDVPGRWDRSRKITIRFQAHRDDTWDDHVRRRLQTGEAPDIAVLRNQKTANEVHQRHLSAGQSLTQGVGTTVASPKVYGGGMLEGHEMPDYYFDELGIPRRY